MKKITLEEANKILSKSKHLIGSNIFFRKNLRQLENIDIQIINKEPIVRFITTVHGKTYFGKSLNETSFFMTFDEFLQYNPSQAVLFEDILNN